MRKQEFFARIAGESKQPLMDHLIGVAAIAERFAATFESGEWGRLAGLWHDLGKYQPEFQRRLAGEAIAVEHSGAGAALALECLRPGALPLAFVIAGHHAGLANYSEQGSSDLSALRKRVERSRQSLQAARAHAPGELLEEMLPELPSLFKPLPGEAPEAAKRRAALWTRFLFSCLVDADRTDSAAFANPDDAVTGLSPVSMDELARRIDDHIAQRAAASEASRVNEIRAEILDQCRRAAAEHPGVFSLTVPTGGGKTLSGMSFALRHAAAHDLRRVIVVLPYTSIIEQNAEVYRSALGAQHVLEHHANLSPEKRREILGDDVSTAHERAEENWDAPVIVTTTVQFFESLYSNRPSRCRKLHNIARSVIILDEVQTLPTGLLPPILEALNGLTNMFHCTVVLSTATPPALTRRQSLPQGLPEPRSIVPDPAPLFRSLSRVRYVWPKHQQPNPTWEELADAIAAHPRVLAIVDRRADARTLSMLVQARAGERVYHLSALMCPAHRLSVIGEIRACLSTSGPCRVISTQLVEAGVDLDFPVVFRALAGLSSIVQAAGRCNREGTLDCGVVHVFIPPEMPRIPEIRQARECVDILLKLHNGALDADDPALFKDYFRSLYAGAAIDQKNILREEQEFNFANVARLFRIIEDAGMRPVVCAWMKGEDAIAEFRRAAEGEWLTRDHYRALQPYTVQIYANELAALLHAGIVMQLSDELFELTPGYWNAYRADFGLMTDPNAKANDGEMIL